MDEREPPAPGQPGVHLEATASDNAVIYQAGRDQHLHFKDGVDGLHRAESSAGPAECPYPGLSAFSAEQSRWFFGRDQILADLIGRLADATNDDGPLMVVGASGTGKSSLLQAGLLPSLQRGTLPAPGARDWARVSFTPATHPMVAAAAHLAAAASDRALDLAVPADPQIADLTSMAHELAGRIVLVVDQFEELFTLCTDDAEREAFIAWLTAVSTSSGGEPPLALAVCGLRADFYAACASYPSLRRALQANQILVGPMSVTELRQVILYPAQAAGLEVEPGLVELLLRDLAFAGAEDRSMADYEGGRLPHLAYALAATWQQRHGHTLTVDGYLTSGGISRAIAQTAERTFGRLPEESQHEARALFLRLVKVTDTGEDVRRPVLRSELLAGSRQPDAARQVCDAYTGNRLLTQATDSVQISHEALISAWPRLRRWIDEDRSGNLVRQETEEAAAIWAASNRESGALLRGARLERARQWASAAPGELNPAGQEYLRASARQERLGARLRRSAVIALAVLTLIATGTAIFALRQKSTIQAQRDHAVFTQVTAEANGLPGTDVSLAAQLDIVSYRLRKTHPILDNLLSLAQTPLSQPLTGAPGPVYSVAFSSASNVLAAATDAGQVQLWDVANPAHPRRLGKPLQAQPPASASLAQVDIIYSVVFDPADADILATGSDSGEIRLWDIADPAKPTSIQVRPPSPPPGAGINAVAFSPDGTVLVGGASDGTIQAWNVDGLTGPRSLGPPVRTTQGSIRSVAFSPVKDLLATAGSDGVIKLWNVGPRTRLSSAGPPIQAGHDHVNSVYFYPNGAFLASGSSDLDVQLWNVANPAHVTRIDAANSGINPVDAVAISPDGRILATSNGTSAQLWSITLNGLLEVGQPLTGDTGPVSTVAFSPDDHVLATGSSDGTIRLWVIPPGLLVGHSIVRSVAFDPRGRFVAGGYNDGSIQLWSAPVAGRTPATAPSAAIGAPVQDSDDSPVDTVAINPGGTVLADGTRDGSIQLWQIAASGLTPIGRPLQPPDGLITSVTFSPDGDLLASGSSDGVIQLWNVASPAHPVQLTPGTSDNGHGQIESVAFSPDGKVLADGTNDGSLQLWSVTSAGRIRIDRSASQRSAGEDVASVAFSPRDGILATGSENDTVQLWNIRNPKNPVPLGPPLRTGSFVLSVTFSPAGTLAAGSTNGLLTLWQLSGQGKVQALGQLPVTAARGIPVSALAFGLSGRFLAIGSFDSAIRIMPMRASDAIRAICRATPDLMTARLWHRYMSTLSYQPPCAARP